jgi:hypothetical protein
MEDESGKKGKVINKLRESKPILIHSDLITERIISRIREERVNAGKVEILFDFLFGWVYVGWIRKAMVTSAAFIIIFFIYQQGVILKRISDLPGEIYSVSEPRQTKFNGDFQGTIKFYRFLDNSLKDGSFEIDEKEVDELIKSMNDLQVKYKDLFEIINKDPRLKKYVDERINKIGAEKSKI